MILLALALAGLFAAALAWPSLAFRGALLRPTQKARLSNPRSRERRLTAAALGVPKVAYRVPGAANAEWIDIYSRLYQERILFLGREIDDQLANQVISILLYLDSEDSTKPIYLYINSAGGSVVSGLAIYDTIQHIKSPVVTINVGFAGSMAAFLLASGAKGKRLALPNSRVMIHQAAGATQGQAEDIRVEARQILQIQSNLVRLYALMTGQEPAIISEDLQRDFFMSAEDAKAYGLIDEVISVQNLTAATQTGTSLDGFAAPASIGLNLAGESRDAELQI